MAKEIGISKGYAVLVDDADFERLSAHRWRALVRTRVDGSVRVYAARNTPASDGKRSFVQMHRVVVNAPQGCEVDHIDGNGLNNTRANLRIVSKSENQRNSRPQTARNGSPLTSSYKGVHWSAARKRWVAKINHLGRQYFLGRFVEEGQAVAAYANAAAGMFGEFARLGAA